MKKIVTAIMALITSLALTPIYAHTQYNTDQLLTFEKTNQCDGCDLSGALLQHNHSGASLNNANLSRIIENGWPGMNLSGASLQNANLSGAYLNDSNFSQADLTGAHFDGADLTRANFKGAKGVDLTNALSICDAIFPDGKKATTAC